ncbi:hypothetical protein N7517_001191 [Penicillium concentricum]|uniref:Uncharacterized protein n=1 Tax=Penicillium concentricum TaxID=293559 RepID=A0A9W9SSE8_9EURO|nr:uncharacterized protein N7517_001191 [Penicillium concentricum]KAJ5383280.1 hypothetical protein N7517_001191 [Penicillium concentricum]
MGRPSNSDVPLEPINHGEQPQLYNLIDSTPVEDSIPGGWECTRQDKTGIRTLYPSFSNNPRALYSLLSTQHKLPPRQYVEIKGLKDKGNDSNEKEIDFNFKLDLTSTLLRLGEDDSEWHELHIVRDGDGKKAFRGGPIPSLEWEQPLGQGNRYQAIDLEGNEDLEDQTLLGAEIDGSNEGTPSLMTWCERFCHDPARVKSFTFTRELEGLDTEPLRSELKSYLRSINYRGHIQITASTRNTFVTVYSPHWINRLRNNSFLWWFCVLTQLWIITLIVITFLERRYRVVHSTWRSSREVKDTLAPSGVKKIYAHGRDETKLADFWAPAVMQAAYDQRDEGEVLTEGSIQHLQQRAQERMENLASFLPERNVTGDSTAESEQPASRGLIKLGVGPQGYTFHAGWGGNRNPTSS